MAKKEKDTYYLKHDMNSAEDPKVAQLISVYGWQGFGWYWRFNEILRQQSDFKLPITGKYAINSFASWMKCDVETATTFIHDCVQEFQLYESDESFIWSNRIIRDMESLERVRDAAKQAGIRSGEARRNKRSYNNELPLGELGTNVHQNGTSVQQNPNDPDENANNLIIFKEDYILSNYNEGIKELERLYPDFFKDLDFRSVFIDWIKMRQFKKVQTLASTVRFMMVKIHQWTDGTPGLAKHIFQYSVDRGYPDIYPPKRDLGDNPTELYTPDTKQKSVESEYDRVKNQIRGGKNGGNF